MAKVYLTSVITIILVNSDGATASELDAEFTTANIKDYAYQPTSLTSAPSSWPTLQTMINKGQRLVVFVASVTASTSYPYLMDEFDFVWETPYDVTSPTSFSCQPDRPSSLSGQISAALASNQLPLMNHFLYSNDLSAFGIEYPNASYAGTTNAPSGGVGNLGSAASRCQRQWGRQPTFIAVDFFNRGPAIETVDNLNGISNPVGRTSLSTSAGSSSSDGSTINNVFKDLVELAASAKSGSTPTVGNWIWVGGNWGSVLGGGISI